MAFGQGTCKPVAPHCDRCVILKYCPQIGVTPRKVPNTGKKTHEEAMRRFVSWNVNGLRAVEKKGFVEILAGLDADLVALQEIKALPEQLPETIRNIPGYSAYWFSAQKKGYAGVATYSKEPPLSVIYGINHHDHDYEGRVLTLEFADFFFVNAYFPNSQHGLARMEYKLAFNRDLLAFAQTLAAKKSVVICGDFNVAHREIDLTNPKQNEKNPGFAPEERAWMDHFLAAGFVDTFRMFNQEPGQYTWWSYRFNARERNIGWRIDYILASPPLAASATSFTSAREFGTSDHAPIAVTFEEKRVEA